MLIWHGRLLACVLVAGSACVVAADERVEFFERHIRPTLIAHCYECHSNARGKSEGGLLLDSRPAMQSGGESGPVLAPGSPDESLLVEAIKYESFEMPPGKQLDERTIQLFEEWIRQGAVDPRDKATAPNDKATDLEVTHWAFHARTKVPVPQPAANWGSSVIDRFILEKLRENQLQPGHEADRATWLRRVTFDLIGLPPAVDELDAFLADERLDAYERVVDRLLASPHYGERWGRYWLDLARYADSNGADENHKYPVAWRYRDYVVAAYNADKPYDRMIHEQLAGDLLPAKSEAERKNNLTATGFLVLGPKMLAEQDKEKMVADIVDEQLDTVGKVFLGLTLGCARCHDHKFDPITAEDYYALAGIFHSTKTMEHLNFVSKWNERELPDQKREQVIARQMPQLQRAKAKLKKLREELRDVEFKRQLELLSRLMLQSGEAVDVAQGNASNEAVDDEVTDQAIKPLIRFLTDQSDIFRVWNELSTVSSERFSDVAKGLWQELAAEASAAPSSSVSARFERRLVAQAAPRNHAELVANYVATLRECRNVLSKDGDDEPLWDVLFGKKSVFDLGREPALYLSLAQESRWDEAKQRVDDLTKAMPALDRVMAADEAKVTLVALHVRGNHLQMSGDPLPRRVPRVLESVIGGSDFPAAASGRLEFARWLTQPDHPLTARVMVNRIWQGHFGHGLVRSTSNFGLRGQEPTHPNLLDWLADEFVRSGWSIKRMHRRIVLSATYRLASSAGSKETRVDPGNLLLSHFPRRRLELEPIRDSLLAIAAQLDYRLGGEAKVTNGSKYGESGIAKTVFDASRRTIYLPINRAALNAVFSTFDYVDPAVSLEQRPTTIVPHQTLFLMNHPLALDAGRKLAECVVAETSDSARRIEFAYKSLFARLPTPEERFIAERFLSAKTGDAQDDQEANAELAAWTCYCRSLLLTSEFLYVD